MIIRSLDGYQDWTFGAGTQNYAQNNDAIAFDIAMNLRMFLGDCFFAVDQGIDWWNLLGGKNVQAISLAINSALLNTSGVTGILNTSFTLDPTTRDLSVVYSVQTVYSTLNGQFVYSTGTL